ncbi:MAG: hypothetical protein A2X99_11065 [Deltaproteobacteria bacterium GWB2_55_19]|nr:MAG: hypothetical protein A2X99_11065 [Deltaproteobacteria bacterium GWB2_55_19]
MLNAGAAYMLQVHRLRPKGVPRPSGYRTEGYKQGDRNLGRRFALGKLLYRVDEVAKIIASSRSGIYELLKRGELIAHNPRLGRKGIKDNR